jgi:hypothetical protein
MEAYYAHVAARAKGERLRVTMFEAKGPRESTAEKIAPSLTPDEILSVVPRGGVLVQKLGMLFSQAGGIRVDDVSNVNGSEAAEAFIGQVQLYSEDEQGHQQRTETLLKLGKTSMDFWQDFYDQADPALRQLLEESNFNPCREPRQPTSTLHDGYRIDLIYGIPHALSKAQGMMGDYQRLGYTACKILSPAEVKALDPFLADFCDSYSDTVESGEPCWKDEAVALYRPGGCLDVEVFLPKFYGYLQEAMGQYTNEAGIEKDCFRLKFGRDVAGVVYADDNSSDNLQIEGLQYGDVVKRNKYHYESSEYVFCPGEAVGTLKRLGFEEPAYAGFAGASLKLNIPIPSDQLESYSSFNHCMEVHREGVVLAWQARFRHDHIFIGVAGTKAFYADQKPHKDQAFAKDRNLLQLNMINDVLPQFISLALGRDTMGQPLNAEDLQYLEERGIAQRWVGTRAVAYDGFPTLGNVYRDTVQVENARCTTHLGSGGVSFAPATVLFSRAFGGRAPVSTSDLEASYALEQAVGIYGSSKRKLQ